MRKATAEARGPRLDRPSIAEAAALGLPFLHHIHPFAKLIVTLIPMIALFFVGGLVIPGTIGAIALLLTLIGTDMRWRTRIALLIGMPLVALILSVTLGLWVDPELVAGSPVLFAVGEWTFRVGSWQLGAETSLRLVAVVALAMLSGTTTSGADFVRALVQQAGVPYRYGYAGLAAFRFVPRFRLELSIIRQAHRARGIAFGRGPAGWVRRQLSSLVPLMAAALRHADRVALSMDARGFGFAAQRTERHILRVRARDWVFSAVLLAVFAAVFVLGIVFGR